MRFITCLCFLLISFSAAARDLVITADGTNTRHKDSFNIRCESEVTGAMFVDAYIPFVAGEKTYYTIKASVPRLYRIGYTQFFASAKDSLTITWDEDSKIYQVFSARYPGNTNLYYSIIAVRIPDQAYKPALDNYLQYVQTVDSLTALKYELLSAAKLSPDVYEYGKAFIHSMHLFQLIQPRRSAAFLKLFPRSTSRYVSVFSDSTFNFPELDASMYQALSVAHYLNTKARLADSANARSYAVRYVCDHFSGYVESLALHALLVNFNFAKNIGKPALREVIRRLQNRELYGVGFETPIRSALIKNLLNGSPLDASLMAATKLKTLEGKTVSLKNLLAQQPAGKDILLDFWASWCQPCIASFAAVAAEENNYTVIYLSMDADEAKWKTAAAKHLPGKTQLLLINNESSALAKQLIISGIPRQVILDRNGLLKEVEYDARMPKTP